MAEEKVRISGEISRSADAPVLPTVNPAAEKSEPPKAAVHPAFYVISSVILFNKWILSTVGFHFPIFLTSWHLGFATLMTQILARTTKLLDGRKTVKMTGRVYLRAIVPIGIFFSLSLICGNLTYLYLSVSFIQMLKATTPVAVLLTSWALGVAEPNMKTLFNVSFIVIGVVIASIGEIDFVVIGVLFQIGGIVFEAIRIVMVQRLLSSAEFKMDPLVSLYYFAPVCAIMNFCVALFWEIPTMTMGDFYNVGFWTLLANAMCAFMLNVSVVFLIGKTSVLIFTLCGVLKDILLVCLSIIIWGTFITHFNASDMRLLSGYLAEGGRQWADLGSRRPVLRKVIVFGLIITTIFTLLGGFAPSYDIHASEYINAAKNAVGSS
ncbi:DUF250 domain membrane protein [Botrytis cinerea]